jgi:capsid protein
VDLMSRFLDTFKGFFTQEVGKRGNPLEKNALMSLGGFEAPVWTRDRSQIWMASQEDTVNPNSFTRNEIVRLTRYLVNNYSLMERILTAAEAYAIGGGLIANAGTKDPVFNTTNTAAFDSWASSVFCFANNQYNFYEAQKLIVRELIIAGEVFIVLIKAGTGYPQLMLVPTEGVRNSGEVGDDSIDGVYIDPYGKILAYNIFTGDTCQKVDASNVIHLMRHKNIGQIRGVGSFAASLNAMRDHKDCIVLEKRALKVHSSLAAVVEKKSGEAGPNGLMGGVFPADGLGNPIPPSKNPPLTTNNGLERNFGGAVVYVEPGEKVNLVSSNRSTDGFMLFLEMLLRDVCLNISLPYEFLVNADKLTGTGVRFVLSDAAFFFGHLQNMIIDGAVNRIYSWVTASFINSKKVAAPVGDLPWAVSFTKPMSITIDPTRISNAEIALLGNSMGNYEAFWSARGKDWKQELAQHAREEAYLDELSKQYDVPIGRLRTLPIGTTLLPAVREQIMDDPAQGNEAEEKAQA